MSIQPATVKQLARKIKDYRARFAFFLGAGASVESRIPAANGMIRDFKRRIVEDECPDCFKTDAEKENWLTTQSWYDANNPYGSLFVRCEPKEIGRQRYIEKLIEGCKPSVGYLMLANLFATGHINTIITTNFDDLVYSACTTFTDIRPIVFAYGVLASEMRVTSPRPKILKLHGDFLYSKLKNTDEETRAQDPNMARQVAQVLNEYGLIVVGYSGGDKSVMDILDQISEKNDLYWCVLRGESPNARVTQLLEAKGGRLIEIDGFDAMLNEIRNVIKFDVATLLGAVFKRQDELIERFKSFPPKEQMADILAEIAEALEKQTEQQKAKATKHRALAHFANGLKAHQAGNLTDAEAAYRKAIELNPNDAAAHNNLGALLAEDAARAADAEAAYREAIRLDPNYAQAHNNLGALLADLGRAAEAEAAYREAIRLDPNLAQAHNNLGVLLDDLGRSAEAEAAYREAIRLDPNNAAANVNLAYFLRTHDRFAEAEPFYRRAIELEPNEIGPYSGITIGLRQQMGREAEAIPFIEKWMQLDPQNFDPPLALASVHKKLGHAEESAKFAAQARALIKPEDWYNLACLESVCGNTDAAIEHLRRAAQADDFDRKHAKRDPDLEWIRDDPRFDEIIGNKPAKDAK
ncbi:MAG: tetratricopeptide repeat protein [Chloroflexota bacterium]